MKVKTSITLEADLVKAIDKAVKTGESRSEVIERMLRESLAATARRAQDEHDRGLIDRHADELNVEVADVLTYQADR